MRELLNDPFYELIKDYPRCIIDDCLIEDDMLHNRTLHISDIFKETKKSDIRVVKPDIEKRFQPKTARHILKLREVFPGQK